MCNGCESVPAVRVDPNRTGLSATDVVPHFLSQYIASPYGGVSQVVFTEWTQAGILRHPSFKGMFHFQPDSKGFGQVGFASTVPLQTAL